MATGKRRVKVDGILYPYRDATESVEIPRKLHHVWKATRGKADDCMNFHCIVDNANLFPHPVIAVHVNKSRVYLFESPEMMVRYILAPKDTVNIDQHDALGIGEPGTLVLHAPTGAHAAGAYKPRSMEAREKGAARAAAARAAAGVKRKKTKKGSDARLAAVVGAASDAE